MYESKLWEERRWFAVVCKDMNMKEGELSVGSSYTVMGTIQGMYILYNDRGELKTYYKGRFQNSMQYFEENS